MAENFGHVVAIGECCTFESALVEERIRPFSSATEIGRRFLFVEKYLYTRTHWVDLMHHSEADGLW